MRRAGALDFEREFCETGGVHPAPDDPAATDIDTGIDTAAAAAALAVERNTCPTCAAPAGSACRGRSGNTALAYHTQRVLLVPALRDAVEVRVPDDRAPGHPGKPGPPVAPAPFRIGYAYCAPGATDDTVDDQIPVLSAVPCTRIFFEQVAASVKQRPLLDVVMKATRAATARHALVLITVTELRRFARTSAELLTLAEVLAADGVGLQVLTGPLAGTHHPRAADPALFTILAAAADLDRAHLREKAREGQRAAAARGRRSGRPKALDEETAALARRLRDEGVPVPEIAARLTISGGKNAGRRPSIASVYRALAAADTPDPATAAALSPEPAPTAHASQPTA